MTKLLDAHKHYESDMVRHREYLKIAEEKGGNDFNAEKQEIVNVLGESGLKFMLDDCKGFPADINFMMPSCVPSTSEDSSGAVIDSIAMAKLIEKYKLFGVGEMMDFRSVIDGDIEVLQKLDTALPIDGHAPLLTGKQLDAYLCSGIMTDHECVSEAEVQEKLAKGMYILLREGSQAKNVRQLIGSVNKRNLSRFMFCTDDRNLSDLANNGSITNCVRVAT